MEATKQKNIAIFQMLLCASLWSIAGIFIKLIPWNSFVIAGWRSMIAAVAVLIFMLIKGYKFRLTGRAIVNGIFMCLTFLSFVSANKLTTAANAIVLQFTAPVFLLVYAALFLKQRLKRADVIAVIFTLGGIALFFLDKLESGYLLGNIVAILAGAFMGAMYLFVGSGDESDRVSGMLLGHLFTAAIGIPFTFFTDTPVSTVSVLSILTLGVFQLGIPYILFVMASRRCPPLACSLLGAVEPLLNPIWVLIFYGEQPGLFALIGGFIVIATVTLWCLWKGKHETEPVST